jgi:uncharacterized protein (TIRG00374 family)
MSEPNGTDNGATRRNIARGVRIFVAIAVVAAVVVIGLTASRETLAGLSRLKWYWLAATVGLWFAAAGLDGLRLAVLSRAGEHPLTAFQAFEIIYIGYFMAAVTPFQVGGLPLQLYIMHRWGISPGKASAMLLVRGVLFYGMLFAAAPFVAMRLGASNALLKVLAGYIAVIIAGGIALVLVSLVFPSKLDAWRERLAAKANPGRLQRWFIWLLGELHGFTGGLRLFLRGRNLGHLLLAALLTVICMTSLFAMSATLLSGLGLPTDAPRAMGINLLLCSVMLFVPTPGASGVAEAGAAGLYSMICPKYMLGVYVVLWRLFSFYLGALAGGILTLRHLGGRKPAPGTSG